MSVKYNLFSFLVNVKIVIYGTPIPKRGRKERVELDQYSLVIYSTVSQLLIISQRQFA